MNLFTIDRSFAAGTTDLTQAKSLLGKIEGAIIDPLILLAFVVALIIFFWGIVKFINASGTGDATGMKTGKANMIWGIIGMTIMISAYGILKIINGTVGQGNLPGI